MDRNALTHLSIANFTAFQKLDLEFSPGINVFIGANATGKTHLLKLMYAACAITQESVRRFDEKLLRVFLPYKWVLNQFLHKGADVARIELSAGNRRLDADIDPHGVPNGFMMRSWSEDEWSTTRINCVYIPTKEMLANAPGFRSAYGVRELHFEEVYADIVDRAFLNPLRPGSRKKKFDEILDGISRPS